MMLQEDTEAMEQYLMSRKEAAENEMDDFLSQIKQLTLDTNNPKLVAEARTIQVHIYSKYQHMTSYPVSGLSQ